MKTIKLTPAVSNKPCDIEYRLKRAHALAFECRQFLEGIDSSAFSGTEHVLAAALAAQTESAVAALREAAPQKRPHVKKEDKPAPEPKVPGRRGRKPKAKPEAVEAPTSGTPAEVVTLDAALAVVDAALNDDLVSAAE